MTAASPATPLAALDTVALDIETTGLDPAKARIVEIGAIYMDATDGQRTRNFLQLVRPGEPIAAVATSIHGIGDEHVAEAPAFGEVRDEFLSFIGDAVVIGHMVGFDLAVLTRECERAGARFPDVQALDTNLLARVAMPELADFSLDHVARKLRARIDNRHSALGDAAGAAAIFRALIPLLREKNIKTFGEALRACQALAPELEQQRRAGWKDVTEENGAFPMATGRTDPFPYRHRIRDIMRVPPVFAPAEMPLADAIAIMGQQKISSIYVLAAGTEPARPAAAKAGIMTERDALRAFAEHGAATLSMPIEQFASRPLACISPDDFVYRAIGRMDRLKIRHLAVVSKEGCIVGAVSARDLLRLRAGEVISLDDEIEHAESAAKLSRAWAKLPAAAAALLAENVSGRGIAEIVSQELAAMTRRAAQLAETQMYDEGYGHAPCPYAVALLGSAARGESLFALDQDNAIVFAEGEPGGEADRWFQRLGEYFTRILHEAGVPYCKGNIMASNAAWRGSLKTWEARVAGWVASSREEDLMAVDIFFDMLGVHGDLRLAEIPWRHGFDVARGNALFAKLLAGASGSVEPGLNFLGGFKTSEGRIDLKKTGLFGIVTAARLLAICHHVVERSTPARLAGLKAKHPNATADLDALDDAQETFLDLIAAQQVEDIARGVPPTNRVSVSRLTKQNRRRLHDALRAVGPLDELIAGLLLDNEEIL